MKRLTFLPTSLPPLLGQLFKPPFTQFLLLCRGLWHCSLILFLANKPRQITTAPGVGRLCVGAITTTTSTHTYAKLQSPVFPWLPHRCSLNKWPGCPEVAWLRNHPPPTLAIISTVIWRSPCALLSLKIGKMCWPGCEMELKLEPKLEPELKPRLDARRILWLALKMCSARRLKCNKSKTHCQSNLLQYLRNMAAQHCGDRRRMVGRASSVGARPYWQSLAGLGFCCRCVHYLFYFIRNYLVLLLKRTEQGSHARIPFIVISVIQHLRYWMERMETARTTSVH